VSGMQIHADKLPSLVEFAHRDLFVWNNVSTPSMCARNGLEERKAPLLHHIRAPRQDGNRE
jgi:hypothetical protein